MSHQLDQVSPGPASRFSKPSFCFFPSARLRQRYWLSDMKLTANQTSPRFVKNDRQAFSGKPYVSQDGDLHQFSWSIAMSLPRAGGKQTISTSTCSYMLVLCSDGVLVKRGPSKSCRGRRHSSLYTRPEQHRVPPSPAWPLGSFPLCLIITQEKKRIRIFGPANCCLARMQQLLPNIASIQFVIIMPIPLTSDKSWLRCSVADNDASCGSTSPHRL